MSNKVSLKLAIDRKENRVLYGEADNTFIDFLFTVLALPVGTVVKLLSTDEPMVGSTSTLLRSVDALNNNINYFELNRHANLLETKNYCLCSSYTSGCRSITATYGANCPQCRKTMTCSATYIPRSDELIIGGSYVKEGKFMVMDDLTVKPMPFSSLSMISILKELNVKDIGSIEEELVYFDINEGVKFLKASEYTTTVLTDLFVRKIDFSKRYVTIVKKEK